MLGSTCVKLEEFITKIRDCKDSIEEADLIAKESAKIRSSLRNDEDAYRHRNIAKLLFMDLLGYNIKYAQLDCVKLIASNKFFEKKIGYIALPLMIDNNSELFLLINNTLKNDLANTSDFTKTTALNVLSIIATDELLLLFAQTLEKLCDANSNSVRKKALVTISKVVLISNECAVFAASKLESFLSNSNHSIIISSLQIYDKLVQLLVDNHKKNTVKNVLTAVQTNLIAEAVYNNAIYITRILISLVNTSYKLNLSFSTLKLDFELLPNIELINFGSVNNPFLIAKLLNSLGKYHDYCQSCNVTINKKLARNVCIIFEAIHYNYIDSNYNNIVIVDLLKLVNSCVKHSVYQQLICLIKVETKFIKLAKSAFEYFLNYFLSSENSTNISFAANLAIKIPSNLLRLAELEDLTTNIMNKPDLAIKICGVKLLGHLINNSNYKSIFDRLVLYYNELYTTNMLLVDPIKAGKNQTITGQTLKISPTVDENIQITSIYALFSKTLLLTLNNILINYKDDIYWSIEKSIQLTIIAEDDYDEIQQDNILKLYMCYPIYWEKIFLTAIESFKSHINSIKLVKLLLELMIHIVNVTEYNIIYTHEERQNEFNKLNQNINKDGKLNNLLNIIDVNHKTIIQNNMHILNSTSNTVINESVNQEIITDVPKLKSLEVDYISILNILKLIGLYYNLIDANEKLNNYNKYTPTSSVKMQFGMSKIFDITDKLITDNNKCCKRFSLTTLDKIYNTDFINLYIQCLAVMAERCKSNKKIRSELMSYIQSVRKNVLSTKVHELTNNYLNLINDNNLSSILSKRIHRTNHKNLLDKKIKLNLNITNEEVATILNKNYMANITNKANFKHNSILKNNIMQNISSNTSHNIRFSDLIDNTGQSLIDSCEKQKNADTQTKQDNDANNLSLVDTLFELEDKKTNKKSNINSELNIILEDDKQDNNNKGECNMTEYSTNKNIETTGKYKHNNANAENKMKLKLLDELF